MQRKRPSPVRQGQPTIYFIADHQLKAVKIGYSANVNDRLSTLQTASAVPLVVLGTMAGSIYQERQLHTRFERVHGEWFKPTEALLNFIYQHAQVTPAFEQVVPQFISAPAAPTAPQRPSKREMAKFLLSVPWGQMLSETLHELAYRQFMLVLLVVSFLMVHFAIVPTYIGPLPIPLSTWLWTDMMFVMACLWALTYTRARKAQRQN